MMKVAIKPDIQNNLDIINHIKTNNLYAIRYRTLNRP